MTSKYNNFAHGESVSGPIAIDISNGELVTSPSTRKTTITKKGSPRKQSGHISPNKSTTKDG